MKKILILIAIILIFSVGLIGCGGSGDTKGDDMSHSTSHENMSEEGPQDNDEDLDMLEDDDFVLDSGGNKGQSQTGIQTYGEKEEE